MEDFVSQSNTGNIHSETPETHGDGGSTQDVVGDEVTSTTGSLPSSKVPAVAVVAPMLPAVSSSEQRDSTVESITDKSGVDEANETKATTMKEEPSVIDDEDDDAEDVGEEKPAKLSNKLMDICDLGCCEFCGGPVKKRRHCSPLKRFCSKGCAKSFKKPKKKDEDNSQESEDAGSGQEGDSKLSWDEYMEQMLKVSAPEDCCKHITIDVPGLKPGMKLEAVDRNNPPSFCVATVIQQVGHRVCIRYDGFGDDDSNDFWCNFQAEELHPIGWCAQNGYPLQPPKGVNSTLEDWRTFLTQTLTGALAAPQDLFRKSQDYFQPRVHGFEVGMKLEAIHPLKPSIICPATVTKSLGPYYFAVTTDYLGDVPVYTFCCHSDSPGIFPVNWCFRNGAELTVPATVEGFTKKTFSWEKYLQVCRTPAAPFQLFKQKVKPHKLRKDMKVEAVDLEYLSVIRVATIANVMGRTLQLFFDGQARFQFIDVDAPDVYPVGWCKRTGHPLSTPIGTIVSDGCKTETEEKIYMPSFAEVMGQQNQATQPVGPPRKTQTREKVAEKKDDLKELKELKDLKDLDSADESDLSEDETGSERFYHNKNQIFFNKSCCIGPLLDPQKISQLPEATPPGKVSSVIRSGLEMVATAARDPEKVIGLMQEGCGVRVMVRHQGKLLKKAISRVDSRPKLERYLKRFCRRLICCEFFLSLKPVGKPCPDKCKADDNGNLQGPKGLKAKRSREYFEVKHLGAEKKKRGRKRKSELLLRDPCSLKRSMVESNKVVTAGGDSVITVGGHKPVIPLGAQPKGHAVPRCVSCTSATVQPVEPVYQAMNTVPCSSRGLPTNTPTAATVHHNPLPSHTTTVGAVQGAHAVIPQGLPTQVLNHPISPMADQGVVKRGTGGGIVTNISGARFAKNATSAGTTITFGRAPPNVTVSSASIPPPLTKIGMDGVHPNTCVPTSVLLEGKNQIPVYSTMSMAASCVNPPPPYTTATTAGRPMSGPRPQVSSGMAPRQRLPSVRFAAQAKPQLPSAQSVHPAPQRPQHPLPQSVNRAPPRPQHPPPQSLNPAPVRPYNPPAQSLNPIRGSTGYAPPAYSASTVSLPSHMPKQNLTPMQASVVSPPPLLHTARPPAVPPRGIAVPTSNMVPVSLPPSRSFQPRFTGNPRGPRPVAVSHPHPMNSPPPLSSSSGTGPRVPGTLVHHVPKTGPRRTIVPNFQGVARGVAPGMPRGNVPTSGESFMIKTANMGPTRRLPAVSSLRGPTVPRTAITGQQGQRTPSVMQSIPYTTTGLTQRSFTVTTAQGVPYMNSVTAASVVRTSHIPMHQQPGKELTKAVPGSTKQAETQLDQNEATHSSEEQVHNDSEDPDKAEAPKKRNLWWLKKRRKKRSRLTYIKTKYRRKDDDRVPTAERPNAEMEGGGVVPPPYSTRRNPDFEKPKRGRPPKGVASGVPVSASGKSKEDLMNSSDPDWDESEGKKVVKPPVKKRKGRFKKDPDSTPPKLSATAFLPEYHNINTGKVGEVGSMIVASLPAIAPAVMMKTPVSPRPQQTAKSPVDIRVSSHLKSPMSKRISHFDGKGSHPFSIHNPVPSSASQAVSAHIPLYARRSTQTRPLCVDVGTNTSLPGCLNGRSPDLPSNPVTWSVEQVVQYVRSTDCGIYAGIFYDQEIDGQSLMLLSRDSLMQFTHMKLGPTLKMCSYIAQLKLRAR